MTGSASWSGGVYASGGSMVTPLPPPSTGHAFLNNTLYRSDAANSIRFITLGTNANSYSIVNNLVYAPNITSTALMVEDGIDYGLTAAGNSSDLEIRNENPLFLSIPTISKQLSIGDFKPTSSPYILNSGVNSFIATDFFNSMRSSNHMIGAVMTN
jgi:hypothetical protein